MRIATLAELFLDVVERDNPVCLMHKVEGRYLPVSTAQLADSVRRLAGTLLEAGIEPGDRVALMAENGPHWPTVDFATLSIGAVLVPVYPTLTPDQAAFIARDSGAKMIFVQGSERYEGLKGERASMPAVEKVVLIPGPDESIGDTTALGDLITQSPPPDAEEFAERARRVQPDDLATFIYTSGTTGDPKGVELSHRNIVSNVVASSEVMAVEGEYTALSFLPLSHSFERTVDYIYFYRGCVIAYAESVQAVAQNLQEVRPHTFVSVPRVYEKVLAKVYENVARRGGLKEKIFHWAVGVGREALPYRLQQRRPPGLLGLKLTLADKLVFGKIRARLGGRFEQATSGGAPLAREVAEFFWGAGIEIYEGYGLSETAPVLTTNYPAAVKLGTVGKALPGVELSIAEDGEILAKGPNIMVGYHGLPEATAEAVDSDGWFHTGDIGELDEEGFLKITDRKKELIVNAYGKNIAPAPIENLLKGSPYIGQAMVIGDRRKFLSALLVPDYETLEPWAKSRGLDPSDREALVRSPEVQKLFADEVESVNGRVARYERIVKWAAVAEEWSVEGGQLTPTLKLKRRIILDRHGEEIDALYAV